MNTTKLIPWNWFKREDEMGMNTPVRASRPYTCLMPVDPLHREMDRLFDSLLGIRRMSPGKSLRNEEAALLRPSLDVTGNDKQYFITVELPGVDEKDLRVELDNDALRIYGEKKQVIEDKGEDGDAGSYYRMERSYGSFQRMLTLPEDVDTAGINASHKDGVLTITLPRREAAKPDNRTIAINKE